MIARRGVITIDIINGSITWNIIVHAENTGPRPRGFMITEDIPWDSESEEEARKRAKAIAFELGIEVVKQL